MRSNFSCLYQFALHECISVGFYKSDLDRLSIMWIFGYGSLIWKVNFPVVRELVGKIKGYNRKFYQLSTDHRGTQENPGRVVTLLPAMHEDDEVWGKAYEIAESDVDAVIKHLDYREKGGYQRQNVLFYPKDVQLSPFEITIYVATQNNFQFGGKADLDTIANQIVKSVGPSGTNIEYILNLCKAMREIAPGIEDDHLFQLETKVLELIKNKKP